MEGRLRKELQEVQRDSGSGVSVERDEGNLTHFTGVLTGPSDTPYQGAHMI
jgi:ubiquitin-conjugating enzyme (huntingtin interacting protein 2)